MKCFYFFCLLIIPLVTFPQQSLPMQIFSNDNLINFDYSSISSMECRIESGKGISGHGKTNFAYGRYEFDIQGRCIVEYHYTCQIRDSTAKQVIWSYNPNGCPELQGSITDTLGWCTYVGSRNKWFHCSQGLIDTVGNWIYDYDPEGRLVNRKYQLGRIASKESQFSYDRQDRLTSIVGDDSLFISYGEGAIIVEKYDSFGHFTYEYVLDSLGLPKMREDYQYNTKRKKHLAKRVIYEYTYR